MDKILQSNFKLNLKVLSFVGMYPSNNYKNLHKLFAYVVYFVTMLPPFLLGSLNFFLNGNTDREDYNDLATMGLILLAPKLLIFLLKSNDLQKLINYFDGKFTMKLNTKQKAILEDCLKICRRNSMVFFGSIAFVMPGISITWYFQGYHLHLPVNVWLPFNSKTNPVSYFCVYSILVIAILYVALTFAAIDSLVPGLLCYASAQLKLLKENLQNLDWYVDEEIGKMCRNIPREFIVYKKIIESVLHYKDIIHFVDEYEHCFSGMVFVQFMESIIVIGLCCFQLIKIQELNGYSFAMTIYLSVLLFQVYFYCYYGTDVLEENKTMSSAIYLSKWYEYDIVSKKALIILMEVSKRSMIVSAGNILEMSLETFTMILKSSYSLIAVLRNL